MDPNNNFANKARTALELGWHFCFSAHSSLFTQRQLYSQCSLSIQRLSECLPVFCEEVLCK